jgi:hypothetical protein
VATATVCNGEFNGQDTREKLTRLAGSEWEGLRWFHADTDDVTEAMLASGLPAIGDPWDLTNLPDLVVTRVGPPAGAWGRAGATGMSGTILIPVAYRTPGIQVLPYEVGDAWTEIASGQSSIQVQTGLIYDGTNWVPDLMLPAINNGQGMQKVVGTLEARVTAVYSESGYHAKKNTWGQYTAEACFNGDAFTVPPIRGGVTPHAIAAGEAQYMGFEMEMIGKGKVRATHRLSLWGTNTYTWFETDEAGMPIQEWNPHPYHIRPFATLL